jgi:agmatine/peptidylarginine deiminase
MKKIYLILLLNILSSTAFSQLDHRMSAQEAAQMPAYLQLVRQQSATTTPPVSAVRASAEWEEIDGLVIAWTSFTTILREIARAAQAETQVLIVCSDSVAVKNSLIAGSVPLQNIHYIIAPFNTIWCRDYGQWNVYTNDVDSLALIDWIYNRPRPNDDAVPTAIQSYTGLPMYSTTAAPYDLIHTGGNFMCDGFGTGFSSNLIINENPGKTEAEIDTIMKKFMGIDRYIKFPTLPYDVIHHIDMHIKLLDEETLLVGEYPTGIADGPQIEANLQFILSNYNSVYGTPYKVVRIPMPPDAGGAFPNTNGDYRTFTNSVFVNKTIILPLYETQYDTTALRIYSEALPGYTVTGINCNSIIPSLGAIHCITKEVASNNPLLISHQALHDTYQTSGTYHVDALIEHRSGIANATLYYRTDTTLAYQSLVMNPVAATLNHWEAELPAQAAGSTVYYYIEGESVSGKTQVRPITAPDGYWKFNVLLNNAVSNYTLRETKLDNPFPNPAAGITCIPVSTKIDEAITLTLKNLLTEECKVIYSGMNSGDKNYFVFANELSAGVYLLQLSTASGSWTKKLVVR